RATAALPEVTPGTLGLGRPSGRPPPGNAAEAPPERRARTRVRSLGVGWGPIGRKGDENLRRRREEDERSAERLPALLEEVAEAERALAEAHAAGAGPEELNRRGTELDAALTAAMRAAYAEERLLVGVRGYTDRICARPPSAPRSCSPPGRRTACTACSGFPAAPPGSEDARPSPRWQDLGEGPARLPRPGRTALSGGRPRKPRGRAGADRRRQDRKWRPTGPISSASTQSPRFPPTSRSAPRSPTRRPRVGSRSATSCPPCAPWPGTCRSR